MDTPTRLEISKSSTGTNLTLTLDGELDLSNVPVLAKQIDEHLSERSALLVLDLREVAFMDSSGLRFLIELNERAEREPWELALIRSRHESANLVLRITGADSALPFEDQSPA